MVSPLGLLYKSTPEIWNRATEDQGVHPWGLPTKEHATSSLSICRLLEKAEVVGGSVGGKKTEKSIVPAQLQPKRSWESLHGNGGGGGHTTTTRTSALLVPAVQDVEDGGTGWDPEGQSYLLQGCQVVPGTLFRRHLPQTDGPRPEKGMLLATTAAPFPQKAGGRHDWHMPPKTTVKLDTVMLLRQQQVGGVIIGIPGLSQLVGATLQAAFPEGGRAKQLGT